MHWNSDKGDSHHTAICKRDCRIGSALLEILVAAVILSIATYSMLTIFITARATFYGSYCSAVTYREAANFINLQHELYKLPLNKEYSFKFFLSKNPVETIQFAEGNVQIKNTEKFYQGTYGRKIEIQTPIPTMAGKKEITHEVDLLEIK